MSGPDLSWGAWLLTLSALLTFVLLIALPDWALLLIVLGGAALYRFKGAS